MNAILKFNTMAVNGVKYLEFEQTKSDKGIIEQRALIDDNGTERRLKVNTNGNGKFIRVQNKTVYLNDLI